MPRVTGIIDEPTDEALRKHCQQFGIAASKLVAKGVPLAIEAHKQEILQHAQTITKPPKR